MTGPSSGHGAGATCCSAPFKASRSANLDPLNAVRQPGQPLGRQPFAESAGHRGAQPHPGEVLVAIRWIVRIRNFGGFQRGDESGLRHTK